MSKSEGDNEKMIVHKITPIRKIMNFQVFIEGNHKNSVKKRVKPWPKKKNIGK